MNIKMNNKFSIHTNYFAMDTTTTITLLFHRNPN